MANKINIYIYRIKNKIITSLDRLSARERNLVYLGIAAIILIIGVQSVKKLNGVFTEQSIAYASAKADLSSASGLIKSFHHLREKRDEIEAAYKKIELNEGALSYLDTLLKEKLGDSVKYTIDPRPAQPFGLSFEQSPFAIRFTVNSFEKLTVLLKAAISGDNPMFITHLDMVKSLRGDGLDINLELSCIQKAGAKQT